MKNIFILYYSRYLCHILCDIKLYTIKKFPGGDNDPFVSLCIHPSLFLPTILRIAWKIEKYPTLRYTNKIQNLIEKFFLNGLRSLV